MLYASVFRALERAQQDDFKIAPQPSVSFKKGQLKTLLILMVDTYFCMAFFFKPCLHIKKTFKGVHNRLLDKKVVQWCPDTV